MAKESFSIAIANAALKDLRDAHKGQSSVTLNNVDRLTELESNILSLKSRMARDIIEIGENLIEAKELLVERGEWINWLEGHIGFSVRTAQNYMRMARTFGGRKDDEQIIGLESSKLFLLQELSSEDRDAFMDKHDVRAMSVRELKDRIKERTQDGADNGHDEAQTGNDEASTGNDGTMAGNDEVLTGNDETLANKDASIADKDASLANVDDEYITEVLKVFDIDSSSRGLQIVPVKDLKPLGRYEEFFGPRKGEEYIKYLHLINDCCKREAAGSEGLRECPGDGDDAAGPRVLDIPITVTKDMTVLDDQEMARACKDLGIEKAVVKYSSISEKMLSYGMTIEEMKIYMSLILHIGRGMDAGPVKLTDSMRKFREEMLQKGIDVFNESPNRED